MKAFLSAAGIGTRLGPVTNNAPKCLLPIRGVPLLGIWLEVGGHFGIDEVLIHAHSHRSIAKDYLRNNHIGTREKYDQVQKSWPGICFQMQVGGYAC